jgi:hypothetical protein
MRKKPKGELPPDWFCENQTSLLDLLAEEENDHADEPDEHPRGLREPARLDP